MSELGEHQLGDVPLWPRPASRDRAVDTAQVEHPHRLQSGDVTADPASAAREPFRMGIERSDERLKRDGPPAVTADADALVPQRRPRDRPAAVDWPDDV